ncbi:hypothetical protein BDW22DRAFT_764941 [Trametopsis cervina]|nr:hypothetical protein BDW22DRAFT_764941 [Trametopsis cervina]
MRKRDGGPRERMRDDEMMIGGQYSTTRTRRSNTVNFARSSFLFEPFVRRPNETLSASVRDQISIARPTATIRQRHHKNVILRKQSSRRAGMYSVLCSGFCVQFCNYDGRTGLDGTRSVGQRNGAHLPGRYWAFACPEHHQLIINSSSSYSPECGGWVGVGVLGLHTVLYTSSASYFRAGTHRRRVSPTQYKDMDMRTAYWYVCVVLHLPGLAGTASMYMYIHPTYTAFHVMIFADSRNRLPSRASERFIFVSHAGQKSSTEENLDTTNEPHPPTLNSPLHRP